VHEAGRLPDELGTAVLAAAREAFTDSLFYVSVICTVVTLLIVVSIAVLRPTPGGDSHVLDGADELEGPDSAGVASRTSP
jgi:DHA2 family multidrug resistance protein-like MFS transporter